MVLRWWWTVMWTSCTPATTRTTTMERRVHACHGCSDSSGWILFSLPACSYKCSRQMLAGLRPWSVCVCVCEWLTRLSRFIIRVCLGCGWPLDWSPYTDSGSNKTKTGKKKTETVTFSDESWWRQAACVVCSEHKTHKTYFRVENVLRVSTRAMFSDSCVEMFISAFFTIFGKGVPRGANYVTAASHPARSFPSELSTWHR